MDMSGARHPKIVSTIADRISAPIAALMAERYWGHWPTLDELASMPAGSLGQAFGTLLQQEGLTLIPKPGIGHHPHGLSDPGPIVEFVLKYAGPAQN